MNIRNGRDLVRKFAELELNIQRLHAAGQPVPPDMATAYQFLDSLARDFSPDEQAALREEVTLHRDAILTAEMQHAHQDLVGQQRNAAHIANALRNDAARKATRSLSRDGQGLNVDQFGQLVREGKYTVPGRQRAWDEIRAAFAEQFPGENPKKLYAKLSALHDSPREMEAFLTKRYGADEAAKAAMRREINAAVIDIGMRERVESRLPKEAFEPRTVEASDSEKRRATVMHVAARLGADEQISGDRIDPRSLEDKGLRGAVARAYAEHEAREADPIDSDTMDAPRDYELATRIAAG